jgi:hypothetical protein
VVIETQTDIRDESNGARLKTAIAFRVEVSSMPGGFFAPPASIGGSANDQVRRRRLSTMSLAAAGQALVNPRKGPKSFVAAKPVM